MLAHKGLANEQEIKFHHGEARRKLVECPDEPRVRHHFIHQWPQRRIEIGNLGLVGESRLGFLELCIVVVGCAPLVDKDGSRDVCTVDDRLFHKNSDSRESAAGPAAKLLRNIFHAATAGRFRGLERSCSGATLVSY